LNTNRLWPVIFTVTGLLAAVFAFTGRFLNKDISVKSLLVATTIPPYKRIIEEIGGQEASVFVMIPADRDPHIYEPTPGQLMRLEKADLYIKIGSRIDFENSLIEGFRSINKGGRVYDSANGIELIDQEPHVWFSAKNLRIIARNIYEALAAELPEEKDGFLENYGKFVARIDNVDEKLKHLSGRVEPKAVLVYHPVLTYFCRDLGLEQICVEREGKEPGSRYIVEVIQKARERNIKKIFMTTGDNAKTAQIIARELNGKAVLFHSLAEDILDAIEDVAEKLAA